MIRRRRKPRRGPLRDQGYKNWLHDRHCVVCVRWRETLTRASFSIVNGCDPAHTQNNGMRSKGPDSSCAPLCRPHHVEYDAGRKAFEEKYGLDMQTEALAHWTLYQMHKAHEAWVEPEMA